MALTPKEQADFRELMKRVALDFGFLETTFVTDIGALLGPATSTQDGTFSQVDKAKLDSIAGETTQSANTVLAGPTSGPAGPATFRSLVVADIPSLGYLPLSPGLYPANSVVAGAAAATNTTALEIRVSPVDGASSVGLRVKSTAVPSGFDFVIADGSTDRFMFSSPSSTLATLSTNSGLMLKSGAAALRTQSGVANGSGPAYIIDTLNALSNDYILEVRNATKTRVQWYLQDSGLIMNVSDQTGTFISGIFFGSGILTPGSATVITPFGDNQSGVGIPSRRFTQVGAYWYDSPVGLQLAAASTITPTSEMHHVTGATTIDTIAATNMPASTNVKFYLIADSAVITWSAAGNIAVAGTVNINNAQLFVYDSSVAKWYPTA